MVAAYHQPAELECSSLYDLLLTADGRLMLLMGEMNLTASAATTAMAIARSSLRTAARSRLSPPDALRQANAALFPELPPEACFACVFAVLDPTTGRLEYGTAGLNPPSILGLPDGEPPASPPLGQILEARFDGRLVDIPLGGQVVVCGHGLLDFNTPRGERFTLERAHELLQALPEEADDPSEVFAAVLRETLGYPSRPKLDLTILALRRRLAG
jgi:serine phosphatase RsbU (regulator of sigma subunit)